MTSKHTPELLEALEAVVNAQQLDELVMAKMKAVIVIRKARGE